MKNPVFEITGYEPPPGNVRWPIQKTKNHLIWKIYTPKRQKARVNTDITVMDFGDCTRVKIFDEKKQQTPY